MKTLAVVILTLLAATFGIAKTPEAQPATGVRFASVDVLLDPRGKPLAAYQIEFIAGSQRVKLVGIEGGEHAAYREPPFYDPAALSKSRVIVAAFSTASNLPSTKTRVARLHLQITGSEKPTWQAKLIVASSDKIDSIPADVTLAEGAKP